MEMVVLYHFLAFVVLFSYGMHHLILASRSHLRISVYAARPYHPLPIVAPHRLHILRHIPLVGILFLLSAASVAPLRFDSHQSSVAILLLAVPLIAAAFPTPLLPVDLLFLVASLAFGLLSSASAASAAALPTSDLQSRAFFLSSLVYLALAASSLTLAVSPRLLPADLTFGASISLRGLWALHSSLSLCADPFIPDGCHRLLEAPFTTRCDLDSLRLRAFAILDLAFTLYAALMAVIVLAVYATVAKAHGSATAGGLGRRYGGGGSYEALPTSSSSGTLNEMENFQMKVVAKNSMQE